MATSGSSSSVVGSPKRFSFPLTFCLFPVRPLGSTVISRFPATMDLSDFRRGPLTVIYSRWQLLRLFDAAPAGSPRFLPDLSLRAAPSHPGKSGDCFYL